MPNILDLLKQILSARYGKDVRQSIHDAIYQCYKDGKAGSIDVDAREQLDEVKTHLDTVEAIAKGKTSALAYETYADMISSFNSMDNESMKRGWNIYIATLNVPDLWIYKVEETASEYTYVDDETFTEELKTNAVVQIGYYKVAALETGKVDLTEYVKSEDIEARLAEIEGDVSELYRNFGGTEEVAVVRADTEVRVVSIDNSKYTPIVASDFKTTSNKLSNLNGLSIKRYSFRFGSENATETYAFGETLPQAPIFLGGRIGERTFDCNEHITGISLRNSSITIGRDSAGSYAGNNFQVIVAY